VQAALWALSESEAVGLSRMPSPLQLDGTLEEWHARMMGHRAQQWDCGSGNMLNANCHVWQQMEHSLHGLPDDGMHAMQNEVTGDPYNPGVTYPCTHEWNQMEGNDKQFGLPSTSNDQFSRYTAPAVGWDQYSGMAPATNITASSPQPPSINTSSYHDSWNSQHIPMGCDSQHTPMGSDWSPSGKTSAKCTKIKNKALREPEAKTNAPLKEPHTLSATEWLNAGCAAFRTDAEISATEKNDCSGERPLQPWQDGSEPRLREAPLEDTISLTKQTSQVGVWDQFEVNRTQFGVVSTFKADLSQYTTPLNLHLIPRNVKDWAKRIAEEIEEEGYPRFRARHRKSPDDNEVEGGDEYNEEELWSSVPRTAGTKKAMAPPPPPPPSRWACRPAGTSWQHPCPQGSQWRVKMPSSQLAAR